MLKVLNSLWAYKQTRLWEKYGKGCEISSDLIF